MEIWIYTSTEIPYRELSLAYQGDTWKCYDAKDSLVQDLHQNNSYTNWPRYLRRWGPRNPNFMTSKPGFVLYLSKLL